MLDLPLDQVLARVELPAEAHAALLGEPGRLRTLLEFVCAYIEGNWNEARARSTELEIPHS